MIGDCKTQEWRVEKISRAKAIAKFYDCFYACLHLKCERYNKYLNKNYQIDKTYTNTYIMISRCILSFPKGIILSFSWL